ncbi:hypothetical protein BS50DRAFT_307706 [Corynespora cassiicola Philippines]|uniref:Uncharacterized protein n=1 Tax=Corynespora cassiicola Philippines TaxID=1448308 RepID=A0A2T2NXN4_CORCC|nr:hypothetical protein BS50DRAFT_307706 [Corynespora cassiicola Philippines]
MESTSVPTIKLCHYNIKSSVTPHRLRPSNFFHSQSFLPLVRLHRLHRLQLHRFALHRHTKAILTLTHTAISLPIVPIVPRHPAPHPKTFPTSTMYHQTLCPATHW